MKTFIFLLTLALLAIPSAVSATDPAVRSRIEARPRLDRTDGLSVTAPASFAGTWKTSRRCVPYTVILTQVGDKVSGTYSPGNGKIFNGVVTDSKLSFKWTEDGGEGFGEFIMNFDGKGFTGTSSAVKSTGGWVVAWKTYTPPVIPFAGVWQTRADGTKDVSLTMVQSGDQVTGSYQGNGKLEGTISGRVLRFKWRSDSGTGSGRFVMEALNNSFIGTYNRGSNPDDVDSTWVGQLPPGPEGRPGPCEPLGVVYSYPKDPRPPEGPRGTGNMSEAELARLQAEYEERQKNAPATFAGVWRIKSGEQMMFPELFLQQANNKVTGRLYAGRPEMGVIKEGIVDRNTLRFQIWRARSFMPYALSDQYVGSGEFVMNADENRSEALSSALPRVELSLPGRVYTQQGESPRHHQRRLK
ncbi:hypothetical protein BH20ACI2_BH20ACI2_21870 [soil metagenome]